MESVKESLNQNNLISGSISSVPNINTDVGENKRTLGIYSGTDLVC